ncbi:hypothetical protein AFCA_000772 [Aspergillus flavus]|nr:hypothetical protein AFCA_000772 [Aspergillus flavus]
MIWEMVLGGMRIHIVQRSDRRMSHVVCPLTNTCDICLGASPQPVKGRARTIGNLLALPTTCRQIYCESIYMLYTMNTFEFSNTWSLTYLRPTIPPSFWDAIRQVELCWAFPGHWLPKSSVFHSPTERQLVLRTGGEDPGFPGTIAGAEPKARVEVAITQAAVLCQGDPKYRWGSAQERY